MQEKDRVELNGVKVYPFVSSAELLDYVKIRKGILIAINAEKIHNATPQTRSIINANIGYCDGVGAVMAMKRKGYKNVVKIPGCELWLEIIRATYKEGKKFYLVGARQSVIEQTVGKLIKDFPGINIVNYRDGYITSDSEEQELLEDIAAHQPDVVFVAMGSPRQELLMSKMQMLHPAIYQGLGGSFDVYTGQVKRAPRWWVEHNLEFAYRLLRQPLRIKRQIKLLIYFLKVQVGLI